MGSEEPSFEGQVMALNKAVNPVAATGLRTQTRRQVIDGFVGYVLGSAPPTVPRRRETAEAGRYSEAPAAGVSCESSFWAEQSKRSIIFGREMPLLLSPNQWWKWIRKDL